MENKPDQKAMRSESSSRICGKHSGFRKLKAYQVAELCCDFTCRFCERYVPVKDRHHDQMVQAARSGYQNLAKRCLKKPVRFILRIGKKPQPE